MGAVVPPRAETESGRVPARRRARRGRARMLRSMPRPKRRPAEDDVGSETIPPPEYSRAALKIAADACRWHHTSAGMRSPHRWWSTILKRRAEKTNETISECRFDSAGFGHGSLLL